MSAKGHEGGRDLLLGAGLPLLLLSHDAESLLVDEAGSLRTIPLLLGIGAFVVVIAYVVWRWNQEKRISARFQDITRNLEQEVSRRAEAEQRLAEKVQTLEVYARTDSIITQSKSFREAAEKLMEMLLDTFSADRAFVLRPQAMDFKDFEILVEATRPEYPGAGTEGGTVPLGESDRALLRPLVSRPGAVTAFGVDSSNRLPEIAIRFGVQSALISSLTTRPGEVWVLGLHQCSHARVWTEADTSLMEEITRRISTPLGNLLLNEALEKSELYFRQLAETIPGVVYQCEADESYTCTFLSPAFETLTGVPPAAILGENRGIAEFIHPEDLPAVHRVVTKAVEGGTPFHLDYRMRHIDGSYRWVEEFGTVIRADGPGSERHLQGFIHDISARVRDEKERRHLDQLNQRLSEITTMRDLGRAMAQAARELFQHDAFFLSQHDRDRGVSLNLYVEDTAENATAPVEVPISAIDFERPLSEMEQKAEATHLEQRGETRNPGLVRIGVVERFSRSLLFAPIRWKGHNLGMISVQSYEDDHYGEEDLALLTQFASQCAGALRRIAAEEELRRSEKIYRDAIHATAGYVYELSFGDAPESWKYDFVDQRIEELLGIPAERLTPWVFRGLVQELDTSTYKQHGFPEDAGRAFRAGEIPFFHVDTLIRTPDGEAKWLSDHAVPVLDPQSGRVIGSLGILQDITTRKRQEHRLAYSNERLALIAEVAAGVIGLQPLVEQAHSIAARVSAAFGVDACVIRNVKDNDPDALHFLAHHGLPESAQIRVISARAGISAAMMRERKPVAISNVREHPATRNLVKGSASPFSFISYAGAPLLHEDKVIGVIGIYSTNREVNFTDEDLSHLQIVANNLAVLITNHELYQSLEENRTRLEKEVTERLRVETALRQSEIQYRSIFEISGDGLAIFHVDGTLVECNSALARLHGITREKVISGSYERFVSEDSRAIFQDFLATVRKGQRFNTHLRLSGPAPNETIDVELHSIPFVLGGRDFVFASIRDITEKKRYDDLLNAERNVLELIARGGESTRLLELQIRMIESRTGKGRGLVLIIDAPDAEIRLGAAPSFPPEIASAFTRLDHRKGSNPVGEAAMSRDMVLIDNLSEVVPTEAVPEGLLSAGIGTSLFLPIEYSGSGPVGIFVYTYSEVGKPPRHHLQLMEMATALMAIVLERERSTRERNALEAQIQHVQKLESLGILAGGIAHDFNNLLVAILGNAGLALMDLRPEAPARPLVERIETAAQRAADLASQMLAYSGRGRFVVEPIDINALIDEMTHLLRISISKKAIIKYNLGENLPHVEGDATQLRQIVMNLVTNASDAIGERSGVITISTGLQIIDAEYLRTTYLNDNLDAGNYYSIEVSDNGCGMDKATAERIFDPFFTTKMTGRGLGLAAVLGIVRGHKGSLKVYSEVGRGTTMKILLPALDEPVSEDLEGGDQANHHHHWKGQGTILVADDEKSVCAVAKSALEKFGFEVIVAYDGQEAIDVFRANKDRISAVLLDLTMPKLNGEEVFRELRQLNPGLPVILTSGYSEQDAVARFAGKGLAAFIHKPWRPVDLIEKFRQVLG